MVKFNPKTHKYTKDGIPVPGVTRVLWETGIIDFSNVPRDVLERASRFGIAVHKACELYDQDNLDECALDPALIPYLNAWIKFKKDTGFKVETIEKKVFSEKYRYAGKPDRTGILHKRRIVLDLKATATIDIATAIQLSAYKEAYNEGKKAIDKIKGREVVQLRGDGTYALAGKDFFKKSDFSVFLAALTLRNFKIRG